MKHTTSALLMAVELALQPSNAQAQKTKGPVDLTDAAFVVVDPQVDFLRSKGATWNLAGEGVKANHTLENLEIPFTAAKANVPYLSLRTSWLQQLG